MNDPLYRFSESISCSWFPSVCISAVFEYIDAVGETGYFDAVRNKNGCRFFMFSISQVDCIFNLCLVLRRITLCRVDDTVVVPGKVYKCPVDVRLIFACPSNC